MPNEPGRFGIDMPPEVRRFVVCAGFLPWLGCVAFVALLWLGFYFAF